MCYKKTFVYKKEKVVREKYFASQQQKYGQRATLQRRNISEK